MIGICSTHGRDGICFQNYDLKNEGKEHLGDLGISGKIDVENIGYECVD
jgi:hypothetical protein